VDPALKPAGVALEYPTRPTSTEDGVMSAPVGSGLCTELSYRRATTSLWRADGWLPCATVHNTAPGVFREQQCGVWFPKLIVLWCMPTILATALTGNVNIPYTSHSCSYWRQMHKSGSSCRHSLYLRDVWRCVLVFLFVNLINSPSESEGGCSGGKGREK
jgi:hypothetical protein